MINDIGQRSDDRKSEESWSIRLSSGFFNKKSSWNWRDVKDWVLYVESKWLINKNIKYKEMQTFMVVILWCVLLWLRKSLKLCECLEMTIKVVKLYSNVEFMKCMIGLNGIQIEGLIKGFVLRTKQDEEKAGARPWRIQLGWRNKKRDRH